MYAANRLLNTGQLSTGQLTGTGAALGAGLGGVLTAAAVIAGIYYLIIKPRQDPGYAAARALSGREQKKLARLTSENQTLREHINDVVCTVESVGRRMTCPA